MRRKTRTCRDFGDFTHLARDDGGSSELVLAPGLDALKESLRQPGPRAQPGEALRRVVRELRDLAGLSFEEVSRELEAFIDALPAAPRDRIDRFAMGLAVGSAFHDELQAASMTDPVTGLPTRAYLSHRVAEASDHAGWLGVPPDAAWKLIVIRSKPAPDLFDWLVQRHRIAGIIRSCFEAGETLASVSSNVIVALAASSQADGARDRCQDALDGARYQTTVWVEPLPADRAELGILLDELGHSLA